MIKRITKSEGLVEPLQIRDFTLIGSTRNRTMVIRRKTFGNELPTRLTIEPRRYYTVRSQNPENQSNDEALKERRLIVTRKPPYWMKKRNQRD